MQLQTYTGKQSVARTQSQRMNETIQLAMDLAAQHNFAQASDLYYSIIDELEQDLGCHCPVAAWKKVILAQLLCETGDLERAMHYFNQASPVLDVSCAHAEMKLWAQVKKSFLVRTNWHEEFGIGHAC